MVLVSSDKITRLSPVYVTGNSAKLRYTLRKCYGCLRNQFLEQLIHIQITLGEYFYETY